MAKMILDKPKRAEWTLQLTLYSGIALIVVSMLFLGREANFSSFLLQAAAVLAAPLCFYAVGYLVYRFLSAPLAAPGIVATGAWLVGVGLIHLYDQRNLLPIEWQPYYWLVASLIGGGVITFTAHKIRSALVFPLLLVAQAAAMWAVLWSFNVDAQWVPAVSFVLVLAWWELPRTEERLANAYRAGGAVLALCLLAFPMLAKVTPESRMVTWAAGAVAIGVIGLRHGWARLGPLAIVMLLGASVWGLHISWWAITWMGLSAVTVLLIEHPGREKSKDSKAAEISEALAVILGGGSTLLAHGGPFFGIETWLLNTIIVSFVGGAMLIWLGWRRELLVAAHAGVWTMAAGWGKLYFVAMPDSNAFGLWLAFFAALALLAERLLATKNKMKGKGSNTLAKALAFWPLADLVLGLSAVIVLWTALHISETPAWITTVTLSIVIGLWVAAGLRYRLPVLLHVALWVAPLPYALLMILSAPSIWTLPLLGVAWQLLGAGYIMFGHSAPRYRPAILIPFFAAGYPLITFGFTVAAAEPTLLPLSLTMIVLTCTTTSAAVIADVHPAWIVIVSALISPEKRPLAYKNVLHTFLHLSAWTGAVWVHVMLGLTGLALPQQGLILMGIAAAFVLIGWLLSRMPGVIGWQMAAAGTLLWITALLEVYYAPVEAPLALIGGAAACLIAWWFTRSRYWMPLLAGLAGFVMMRYGVPLLLSSMWFGGLLLCVIGLEFIRAQRPRRVRSFYWLYFGEIDWGMGLLWAGSVALVLGLYLVMRANVPLTAPLLIVAATATAYTVRQPIMGLPYLPLALITLVSAWHFSGSLVSYNGTRQGIPVLIVGFALLAALIRAGSFLLLRRLDGMRRVRWLVWWIRPLLVVAVFSHALGAIMLVVLAPLYKLTMPLTGLSALLLTIYAVLAYVQQRREMWLWLSLALTGLTVALSFDGLGLSQPVWTTFILGLLALTFSRVSLNWRQMEWIGVAMMIVGAGLSVNRTALVTLPNLGAMAVLPSLLLYGYLRGRRIPFAAGAGLLGLGLLLLVVRINPWLIPLGCGVLLIGSTLLIEVRRDLVEGWLDTCASRWQAWQ